MLLSSLLAACSPQYNWRQLTVAGGAVTAFFPDKPVTQERSLPFSGHAIAFSMTSATVDGALFTVAYAALPEALRADEAVRKEFAAAVVGSLYRNLGQEPPQTIPVSGESFTIEGESPDGAITLQARAWLTGQGLVEGIVTAARDRFPEPQAAEFLHGVEPSR
ncbi:hypothetical protein [Pollutimonas sp. M17]|uniref:hypothetical protein n=1 Tax=Pollutimonas sp. M17 TaxID=2962065 RepID=UPI0021F4EAC2|nr:hypothetical protein [Pollutimonas sp. M17]UYO94212.1 hypothetical protein OEG81_02445 [Pollutimonas sp. M17]HWK71262.1 hypothetical protein [Burkholderiaceae bacterium]